MSKLIIKFRHHKRDVRPPFPLPSPSSPDNDFHDFYHIFDANHYKNPPPQTGFDYPVCGGKNPVWAGIPGSGGGDGFL